MMDKNVLRVAVGQFPASNDIETNKQYIQQLVEQSAAQSVELLVLPEAAMCSFASDLPVLQTLAYQHTPAFIQFIQTLAKQYQLFIVVGVISPSEYSDEPRVQNQLVVINPQGEIIVRYNKIHVYDAFKFKESDKVKPADIKVDGSMLGVFKIKDFTIGLINCYDLRFPELARALIDKGVNVLSVSANWIAGSAKEMHWETLLKARAIENTAYVLASGQTPTKGIGNSMIIDPMGMILAGCGTEIGVQVQTLSLERLNTVRTLLPCLVNRRLF
ncbi:carbon-nitrogen hydrolase family protein [Pelistega sp. NLN82]|uniref:Carbon-nitrogen hydrolase family protein n=1 Tax=Pelistega ratti TaxID=2652177 RepID=A0A6L9Y458_9BURK|nr:carbon-nitrogen hydrolase family protein [Pelistega ratti]NEN74747.1 carbon-nitrogen hydrolase family protein [Pelistega ratti]